MKKSLSVLFALSIVCFSSANTQAGEITSLDLVRQSAGALEARLPYQPSTSLREGDRLELASDDGLDFGLTISKTSYSNLGNRIIHATTDAGGNAILVVSSDGAMLGSISEYGERHQISTTADGLKRIVREGYTGFEERIDEGGLAPEQVAPDAEIQLELGELETYSTPSRIMKNEQSSEVIYPTYKTGTATISVLMYYDDSMSNPLSTIDFITQLANDVFADSGVQIKVDIVGTRSLDIDDDMPHADVQSAMNEEVSPFEGIAADRRFFAADLVYVLRATRSSEDENVCGLAPYGVFNNYHFRSQFEGLVQWKPSNGFDSFCYDLTFAHELGHSLGAAHNREELTDDGEVPLGAYSYSYGRTIPGVIRTVMGYTIDGNEPYEPLFSSPALACGGYACGKPAGTADSADNVSTFHSTGHLVASNEGPFAYEAVSSYARRVGESECTTSDDEAGFWTGAILRNQSAFAVELLSQHWKRVDGSYAVFEFDPGERVAESGSSTGGGWCRAESADPIFGTIYTEVFMRYRHPETGAIVETEAHEAASDYEGEYRTVRVASGEGGSVSGNTTKSVRVGSSQTFNFTPDNGYVIDSIQSNCSGQRNGTSFTVDVGQDNCFVEAIFAEIVDEGTLRLSLEGPRANESYSGLGTLRGWAVAEEGIDYVEIYIDDVFFQNAPYGGKRLDVGNIFPEIEGSSDSGYALAFNYSNLSEGSHTIKAVAVTNNGRQIEKTSRISIAKFHKDFIRPSDEVDLNSASCSVYDSEISVINALIDGRVYDVSMKWRSSDQGFEIYEIR